MYCELKKLSVTGLHLENALENNLLKQTTILLFMTLVSIISTYTVHILKTFVPTIIKKKFRFWKKKKSAPILLPLIGPWFRFPIPKPGFGRTLIEI